MLFFHFCRKKCSKFISAVFERKNLEEKLTSPQNISIYFRLFQMFSAGREVMQNILAIDSHVKISHVIACNWKFEC